MKRCSKLRLLLSAGKLGFLLYWALGRASGQTWVQTDAPIANWSSIASSSDGSNLFAVAYADGYGHFGGLLVSTNSGLTWTDTSPSANEWMSVASSTGGDKVVAAEGYYGGGFIYVSTNSGLTWVQTSAPSNIWFAVTSSADGGKLAAASLSTYGDGLIYSSTNGGGSWMPTSAPRLPWVSLVSSADGSKLMAVASLTIGAGGGYTTWSGIYTSSDAGGTWLSATTSTNPLFSGACSADGTKLAAIGDVTLLSTNSGQTWFTNLTISGAGVSSSADGTRLLITSAAAIHISTDWGATWSSLSPPANFSSGPSALSADGTRALLASYRDHLYQLNSAPTPRLEVRVVSDNIVLAWCLPSLKLVLQQSSDLKNWADVNISPLLNLSSLKLEVTIPPSQFAFYRLLSH